jgi:hypothetical protein
MRLTRGDAGGEAFAPDATSDRRTLADELAIGRRTAGNSA